MLWEEYKSEFSCDGNPRDLCIDGVDQRDWQSMLSFIRSTHASMDFYIDGKVAALPSNLTDVLNNSQHDYLLKMHFGGVNIQCDFLTPEQIQLAIDPSEIDDEFKANLIFRLMSTIGRTLDKPVVFAQGNQQEKTIFEYKPGETVEYVATR